MKLVISLKLFRPKLYAEDGAIALRTLSPSTQVASVAHMFILCNIVDFDDGIVGPIG